MYVYISKEFTHPIAATLFDGDTQCRVQTIQILYFCMLYMLQTFLIFWRVHKSQRFRGLYQFSNYVQMQQYNDIVTIYVNCVIVNKTVKTNYGDS